MKELMRVQPKPNLDGLLETLTQIKNAGYSGQIIINQDFNDCPIEYADIVVYEYIDEQTDTPKYLIQLE